MFVLHLGISGFPRGNAPIQRIRLTFKALKNAGLFPLIINKHSIHVNSVKTKQRIYRSDGLFYINTSYLPYKPLNFLSRNLNKLSGSFAEFFFLLFRRRKIHSAIYYGSSFGELVYYRSLSKLFGFKLVIQYVELRSAIPNDGHFFFDWNNRLLDRYCHKLCDGAIAISEYLKKCLAEKRPDLPILKVPAICDFDEFAAISPAANTEGAYLMYCGTIVYYQVVEFVVDLYRRLKEDGIFSGNLVLVVSGGNAEKMSALKSMIAAKGLGENVRIKSNIAYSELINLYRNAKMLFIPLRNTFQDIARFPHKIGEYTAAGRPVVSTNIGEVAYYLHDMQSALLADEFDFDAYYNKLKTVIADDDLLNEIGSNGYRIGLQHFDYKNYEAPLFDFLHLKVQD
jgi:glycosyltransferase involved in cell wall biosynthesis